MNIIITLISIAVVLQSIELIRLRQTFNDNGIWRISDLQIDFAHLPILFRGALQFLLSYKIFLALLFAQFYCALILLFHLHPLLLGTMFVTSLLAAVRWRGAFNGGSDAMTILILGALTLATAFPDNEVIVVGAICYIAVQAVMSYFIAGLAKVRQTAWRNGEALSVFIANGPFLTPPTIMRVLNNKRVAFVAAWTIIAFELFFPLALLTPQLCAVFLVAALSFHIINAYLLGLNRFVFAWVAAFPAIYWGSHFAF